MKEYDMKYIFDKATGAAPGIVHDKEIEYARSALKLHRGKIDIALRIIGICGNANDIPLIEKYLSGEFKEAHGDSALKALCRDRGLVDIYYEYILDILRQKEHESIGDMRICAISLSGDSLEKRKDKQILEELVRILNDSDEPPWNRAAAYESLRLTAKDKISFRSDIFPGDNEWDPSVQKISLEVRAIIK